MRLFRDLTLLYFSGVPVILVLWTLLPRNPMVSLCAFLVGAVLLILLATVLNKTANKRLQVVLQKREQGQLREYIAYFENLLRRAWGQKAKNHIKLYLVNGYMDVGEFDKAWGLLASIPPGMPKKPADIPLYYMYYSSLCAFYLHAEDAENAARVLPSLERIAEHPSLPAAHKAVYTDGVAGFRVRLKILRGDYEGCAAFFEEKRATETAPYLQMLNHYWLMQIYKAENRKDEALASCRYVIEHSGESRHATVAKEIEAALTASQE